MFGNFKIEKPEVRASFGDSRVGKVDVADTDSVKKWAQVLGITENELLDSVDTYGSVIADIRKGRRSRRA